MAAVLWQCLHGCHAFCTFKLLCIERVLLQALHLHPVVAMQREQLNCVPCSSVLAGSKGVGAKCARILCCVYVLCEQLQCMLAKP
jgi:hypothetical protein